MSFHQIDKLPREGIHGQGEEGPASRAPLHDPHKDMEGEVVRVSDQAEISNTRVDHLEKARRGGGRCIARRTAESQLWATLEKPWTKSQVT
eukprot:5089371-Pyramimonas_sp.AAC.1